MTSFYCVAWAFWPAFWIQTNHHPIDLTWCVWNQQSDYEVSLYQRITYPIYSCFFFITTFWDLSLLVSWLRMMYWSRGWVGVSRESISSIALNQMVVLVTETWRPLRCSLLLTFEEFDPSQYDHLTRAALEILLQETPTQPLDQFIIRNQETSRERSWNVVLQKMWVTGIC